MLHLYTRSGWQVDAAVWVAPSLGGEGRARRRVRVPPGPSVPALHYADQPRTSSGQRDTRLTGYDAGRTEGALNLYIFLQPDLHSRLAPGIPGFWPLRLLPFSRSSIPNA